MSRAGPSLPAGWCWQPSVPPRQRRSPRALAAVHGRCQEILLSPLGLEAIEAYLSAQLGDGSRGAKLRETARVLLERTDGNPLFMVSIVNQLAQVKTAAPDQSAQSLRMCVASSR